MWNDFHAEEIGEDFSALADLGVDHIRLQTIWPWFHPLPNWVSPAHLDRLKTVFDLAAGRGLDVSLAVFTGWLSGFAFRPPFIPLDGFYTDPIAIDRSKFYLRVLASAVGDRENLLGFDLGNEMNVVWTTSDIEAGDAWNREMISLCDDLMPGKIHVNGVDHQPWFSPNTLSPKGLCEMTAAVLHVYTYWSHAQSRYPLDSPLVRELPTHLARLARSFASDSTKPVWLQEFGQSRLCWEESAIPDYLDGVVRSGVREGICWFTWWASHDVPESLEFHPFEYDLGLLDTSNKIKPVGCRFRELAAEFAGKAVVIPNQELREPPAHELEAVWNWLEKGA
jgi:endo-1,4-beta-mannosidase